MHTRDTKAMTESGMTLVELLVTMVISLVMAAGIYAAFQSTQFADMNTQETASLLSGSRTAVTIMDSSLENAGFLTSGVMGASMCPTLLAYNGNASTSVTPALYPVSAMPQSTSEDIPGTNVAYTTSGPPGMGTQAITTVSAGAFSGRGPLGNGLFSVVKTSPGTLNNASLFLNSTYQAAVGDLDIVMLPASGVCIRMQVTNVGGANNIVHNSGTSALNPPNGFNGVSATASPAIAPITLTDFQDAYVEDLGPPGKNSGFMQTTYSIGVTGNGGTALFQTVVNGSGQTISNGPIIANAVDLQALFGVMQNGHVVYQPWSQTIASQIVSVQYAILLRSASPLKNYVSPATIPVLTGITYNVPADQMDYRYQVIQRTVVLRNSLL